MSECRGRSKKGLDFEICGGAHSKRERLRSAGVPSLAGLRIVQMRSVVFSLYRGCGCASLRSSECSCYAFIGIFALASAALSACVLYGGCLSLEAATRSNGLSDPDRFKGRYKICALG